MAMPTDISNWADELYQAMAPVADQEESADWALLKYIIGIASMGYDQITSYARDTDDGDPGWSVLMDVDRCPTEALPYLGQFVGVDVSRFARIQVHGVNISPDPFGQEVLSTFTTDSGAPVSLPDGAVPVDTVATDLVDKAWKGTSVGLTVSCQQNLETIPGVLYNVSVDIFVPAGQQAGFSIIDNSTSLNITIDAAPVIGPVVSDGWVNIGASFIGPPAGVADPPVSIHPFCGGTLGYFTNFQVLPLQEETDDEYYDRMRTWIRATVGFFRGSPASFEAAAQQYLIGTKTVIIRERDSSVSAVADGAYGLSVLTYGSETPDPAKVLAALLEQKPAGIIMDYEVIDGTVYIVIRTLYATYNDILTAFLTYNGLRNNAPGT